MKEQKEQAPTVQYPCGYKLCDNTHLSILFEDEKEILIWCEEHQAKTWYSKRERPKSQTMKPEFKDIYKF